MSLPDEIFNALRSAEIFELKLTSRLENKFVFNLLLIRGIGTGGIMSAQ